MANRWTWRRADEAAAGAAPATRAAAAGRSGPLAVAIAAALGIAAAPLLDALGVPSGPRWLIAAAAVVAWRRVVHWRGPLLLAAGVALGAARGARPEVVAPAGVTVDDRTADRVIGVVRGPVVHGPRGDGARLDTGAAAIWLWSDQHLVPGERVAATGAVRTPRGLRDPAVPDRADAAHARGAELELTARQLERLGDAGGPGAVIDRAWRWAGATQAAWAHAIDEAGGDPVGRAALRGIAVGDRGEVPPALDQRWRAVGIYHGAARAARGSGAADDRAWVMPNADAVGYSRTAFEGDLLPHLIAHLADLSAAERVGLVGDRAHGCLPGMPPRRAAEHPGVPRQSLTPDRSRCESRRIASGGKGVRWPGR